ncbi:MAG: D-tagatose-bisphosphate aldolase, class II, non-catalytic subunit [Gammaproteobacteria bacterium]
MKAILQQIHRHKSGQPVGLYSVCCAHPLAIEAALVHAQGTGGTALIEATSNQVNQDGGYTGLTPPEFVDLVLGICARIDFPPEKLLLGGDHLGPNAWQHLPADEAMSKAVVLVEQYLAAGFRKIHLDCSMSCAGDPVPLGDEIIAARTTVLCAAVEATWRKVGGEAPVYIIGSEVPVPGGAHETLGELSVTSPRAAADTIDAHRNAFAANGLADVWPRVIGLVVQPGVEFDHREVIEYVPGKAADLSRFIDSQATMVYEAHSTDYQSEACLSDLVRDHFAILKVGPGVTFALREALWALDRIEQEWLGASAASGLRDITLGVMNAEPRHWSKYYSESGARLQFDLQYSLSDRIRYYWPHAAVERALTTMLENLNRNPPPLALISQYLPQEYQAIRAGRLNYRARDLIIHRIGTVLEQYSRACRSGE